jgi:hypothetical protein
MVRTRCGKNAGFNIICKARVPDKQDPDPSVPEYFDRLFEPVR